MSKDSSSGELNEPKINRNLLKLASDMPRVGDGGGLEEGIRLSAFSILPTTGLFCSTEVVIQPFYRSHQCRA
jgi:hypothetical protein